MTSTYQPTLKIEENGRELVCRVYWDGVDRPSTYSLTLRKSRRGLAKRFKKAVEDGKVFTDLKVVKDVNGKTYMMSSCKVIGRTLNADLRNLGY